MSNTSIGQDKTEDTVDAEVFKKSYIPRVLDDVKNFERDLSKVLKDQFWSYVFRCSWICFGYIRKILSVHRYETASRLDNVIDFMNSKNIIFTDKLGGEIHWLVLQYSCTDTVS